jgi:pimeloyl-ACP methyl ester carboxylesterase
MPRSRLRRRLPAVVTTVAVLVVAGWFGIGWIAADRLTFPERHLDPAVTPATFGATYQDVTFAAADGVELAGWYLPVEGSDAGVVLVHGRNSSRTREFGGRFPELAATLQANGYQVVMLDLRGHGASGEARFTFGRNERLDVGAAITYLVAQGVPAGQVGVLGVSMGAASAVGATAVDPRVGALWADAGYAEIASIIEAEWPSASGLPQVFWHAARLAHRVRFGFDLAGSRPADELPLVAPRPIQLVHGTGDLLIPYDHVLRLRAAEPSAGLWTLEGVGHADAYEAEPDEYARRVIEFFDAALRIQVASGR